jgi:hypothetical protein
MDIIVAITLITLISLNELLKMIKVRKRSFKIRAKQNDRLFDEHFIEPKSLYIKVFKILPSVVYIENVDTKKIFELISAGKYNKVKSVYQRLYHNWNDDKVLFGRAIFILENKMLVKLCDEWIEIYFESKNYDKAQILLNEFKSCKVAEKENDFEINIISMSNDALDLKTLAINPTILDLDLYYNDDFKAVDALIKERLAKEKDKGIVLLHGLPGTGKTTYLRYLIGNLKKKVMFVSPSVAGNLMNPEFMDLLLDNPNAVLVIEDAENIIMDRRYSSQSSVSNLLNISDGLLSDCLNVQIICTFNSELGFIDSALLRKGRLIARYEFGKLSVDKAKALRDHLGLTTEINKPMTLAEVTNPDDNYQGTIKPNTIGFRKEVLMEN